MIPLDLIPNKSPQTASRIIDNEAVIIVPEYSEVKVLNEVGSRIWELLDGNKDIQTIAYIISDEFEAPLDKIIEDVKDFIEELSKKKIAELK